VREGIACQNRLASPRNARLLPLLLAAYRGYSAPKIPGALTMDYPRLIAELMRKYTYHRTLWVASFGSAKGFDKWFTSQTKGALSPDNPKPQERR